MEKIITDDESPTYFNEQYQETYHTRSGAVEESIKKFCEPAELAKKAQKGIVRILDVCFGLGYNSAAAIDMIRSVNPVCRIEVVGLENDPLILQKMSEVQPAFTHFPIFQKITPMNLTYQKDNISIHILLGDARETIKQTTGPFDAIFLDPFSPKKCPELWTEPFFKEIHARTAPDGILTTYSCARVVRDNLKAVGFRVEDGPAIGRRSHATIAYFK